MGSPEELVLRDENQQLRTRIAELERELAECSDLKKALEEFREGTERKRTEEALHESDARLRLAQQVAGIGTFDWNVQTGVNAWTPELEAMHGLPPGGFRGNQSAWENLLHPDDRAGALKRVMQSFGTGTPMEGEWRVVWPDGSIHWLAGRWRVFRDASGAPLRVMGVNIDVTDRKHTEAMLRENDLQYKEVFDNISVCLFLIDVTPDGRFKLVAFNPAEEEVVGLSTAEVSGKFVEDVFNEELASKLTANYRRCLEAGRAIRYNDKLDLPKGPRYFVTNLIPLRNAAGITHRIVGACIDVTDLRRAQEGALAKQNLESLGVLAGGIAHDFNNVLGGILAQAELAETDLALGSAVSEEIEKIKAASIRGSEIVRELLVYAGQDQTDLVEAVDVSQLVQEMLELLKVSIAKHVVLKTDLRPGLPAVWANASQLRQVVMNLVINASEANGDKKGAVTVSVAQVRGGSDSTSNNATDLPCSDYVRLEVSDTGSGIAEKVKERIFDPFFSTKFAGRGMGLAVVQRIVRDHGGAIHLVSALGQGTTFQVLLPCAPVKVSKAPGDTIPTEPEQSNARAGTVLVVEDEEILRLGVCKALRKTGFTVIEASDGSAAMDLIRAYKGEISLVLLDVTLPGMSSRQVFEGALRMRGDVKVILTSAYGKETVDATFSGLRVEHFIRKPFHLKDLVRLFGTVLSAKLSAGQSL